MANLANAVTNETELWRHSRLQYHELTQRQLYRTRTEVATYWPSKINSHMRGCLMSLEGHLYTFPLYLKSFELSDYFQHQAFSIPSRSAFIQHHCSTDQNMMPSHTHGEIRLKLYRWQIMIAGSYTTSPKTLNLL